MNNPQAIAEQYLAAWNERDAAARRAKVANLFTLDAAYVDPLMRGAGHAEIDALIGAAQQHFPGHRFVQAGAADGHNRALRFSWTLQAPDGRTVAGGTDFATFDADGRLAAVTGFLDNVA